jgi:hypothetical protein
VFYIAENRHIIELWWRSGETPHAEDLTDRSGGAPLPFLGLTSHVFDAEGTQHVFYRADNGHIIEIWWRPGEIHQEDLTDRSPGAPLAGLGGAMRSVMSSRPRAPSTSSMRRPTTSS